MSVVNAGVQAIIRSKSSQAVYVHCHAHRLNLVLVDVVKKVPLASQFFSLLQALYVFMSSAKSHEQFLTVQKARGGREIRLRKLSDARWCCQIESIKAILSTYHAVLETLQIIVDGTDRPRGIEASGILAGVNCFQFIVSLVVYKKVFGITANLSEMIHAECLDYGNAVSLVQAVISTFSTMRSEDDQWDQLWQEAEALATHVGCPIEPTQTRRRATRQTLQDYILTANTVGNYHISGSSKENYKVDLFYPTLDHILLKMRERFAEGNIVLMKSFACLQPKSKYFLDIPTLTPLLTHYNIDTDGIDTEVLTFKNFLANNPLKEEQKGLHDMFEVLTSLKDAFPILTNCVQIGLTFGTSTATVERSFSSLRRIDTYLRSTMSQDRLDDLAILNIERDLSSKLWNELESLVPKFAQIHGNSKILLL